MVQVEHHHHLPPVWGVIAYILWIVQEDGMVACSITRQGSRGRCSLDEGGDQMEGVIQGRAELEAVEGQGFPRDTVHVLQLTLEMLLENQLQEAP